MGNRDSSQNVIAGSQREETKGKETVRGGARRHVKDRIRSKVSLSGNQKGGFGAP